MRLMSSTSRERIFTTIRNLFHTFMFYILKSAYLYRSRGLFFLINIFYFFWSILLPFSGYGSQARTMKWNVGDMLFCCRICKQQQIVFLLFYNSFLWICILYFWVLRHVFPLSHPYTEPPSYYPTLHLYLETNWETRRKFTKLHNVVQRTLELRDHRDTFFHGRKSKLLVLTESIILLTTEFAILPPTKRVA